MFFWLFWIVDVKNKIFFKKILFWWILKWKIFWKITATTILNIILIVIIHFLKMSLKNNQWDVEYYKTIKLLKRDLDNYIIIIIMNLLARCCAWLIKHLEVYIYKKAFWGFFFLIIAYWGLLISCSHFICSIISWFKDKGW